jgi:hypothetical protein
MFGPQARTPDCAAVARTGWKLTNLTQASAEGHNPKKQNAKAVIDRFGSLISDLG